MILSLSVIELDIEWCRKVSGKRFQKKLIDMLSAVDNFIYKFTSESP